MPTWLPEFLYALAAIFVAWIISRVAHFLLNRLVKKYVEWGISPRGGQYLLAGAKARAFLYGRPTPSMEDVKSIVHAVFDHRIIVNFLAEADGILSEKITEVILNETD